MTAADFTDQIRAELACGSCASEVRVTAGAGRYHRYRARVIHADGCPWYVNHAARVPGYLGAVPCSTVVTHRGPYKRDPARGRS